MGTFGFRVALIVALFGMTTCRPPICEKPPPWTLDGVDHMQATQLSRLLNDFYSADLSDLRILIINEAERRSRNLFKKLKTSAKTIPVYQDKLEVERNQTLWSLLEGGKDDFYIYDRCGRLTYYVPYPISFLNRPYAKAAILATYFDEPCGPCPTDAPPIATSNCSMSDLNSTEDNCTVTDTLTVDNSTDLSLNDTLDDPIVDQNFTTTRSLVSPGITSTTVNPSRAQFQPVIEEFNERYGNQTGHGPKRHMFHHRGHGRPSFRRYGHRMNHGHRQSNQTSPMHHGHRMNHGHRQLNETSPIHHGHNRSNETVPTSQMHHGQHHGHGHHHGHGQNHSHVRHAHHNKGERFGPKSRQSVQNTSHHHHHFEDTNGKQLVNQSESETNSTDDFETSNMTTTVKPMPQLSSAFYESFYPNYEVILNLALADWLKKPIPQTTTVAPATTTTTTTVIPATILQTTATSDPKMTSTQAHMSYLVEILKRAKSRQQSEMIH